MHCVFRYDKLQQWGIGAGLVACSCLALYGYTWQYRPWSVHASALQNTLVYLTAAATVGSCCAECVGCEWMLLCSAVASIPSVLRASVARLTHEIQRWYLRCTGGYVGPLEEGEEDTSMIGELERLKQRAREKKSLK